MENKNYMIQVKVKDLVKGWSHKDVEYIWNGKLTVNKNAHREYLWKENDIKQFIDTLKEIYYMPSVIMIYKRKDDSFELVDGFQRVKTLCDFYDSADYLSMNNEDREKFDNIDINICVIEGSEKYKIQNFCLANGEYAWVKIDKLTAHLKG